jgi:hypothetical protein
MGPRAGDCLEADFGELIGAGVEDGGSVCEPAEIVT